MALTGKQRRYLRSLGHALPAVVLVGKEGLTDEVADVTREQLRAHELVKVKLVAKNDVGLDRHDAAAQLAKTTGSEVAQVLGKTFLLYRRREETPKLVLP